MIILKVLAYSVERIAYSKKLNASRIAGSRPPLHSIAGKRYPLNAKAWLFLIFAFFALHSNCYAQSISSTELINNAKLYDGKAVIYEGEVIADIMVRGGYAWINVNDGQNAIGIWVDKNLTKDILFTGSYKSKGEWLEINGIFQRACLEHGGDLDIHAQAIRKIRPGRQTIERLNIGKKNRVFVLLGVLCLVAVLKLLK